MLKRKLKACKSCGLDKVIWKEGKCVDCCKPSFKTLSNSNTKTLGKGTNFRLKKTLKSNKKNKEFFNLVYERFKDSAVSFESGKPLGKLGTVNMAHIFPKERYKSLAHNYENIILLTWEEHTRFDDLLSAHDFGLLEDEFESWSRICERIKILLPLCKEEGRLKTALKEYLT